ncbi:molybdopterin-binding oxidoreductase [Pseudomonas sp. o96-267]|uniref:molybdopterin-dependent oxidoreductase n=1 Tax=Pseudomonas sp. o96-267 TaxID=2479853 RepID=UPI000F76ABD5|nr:molybdopterin-dependent oxidoreductase [Pseudomonas sp. o96-267]RRV26244.1 molybdopterin-binding oxidoreductase [Pseudomonas sp. o96-267]
MNGLLAFNAPAPVRRGVFIRWVWALSLGLLGLVSAPHTGAEETLLSVRHGSEVVPISAAQFEQLPWLRIETSTAWTDGVQRFEGPLVRDVLTAAGVDPGTASAVTLVAWNDYEIKVEAADYYQWDVILARTLDGTPMTLADYGPLWVVYPRDAVPALADSRYDHRWVWMLKRMEVEP